MADMKPRCAALRTDLTHRHSCILMPGHPIVTLGPRTCWRSPGSTRPREETHVLERNEEVVAPSRYRATFGSTPGNVLHVKAARLEFTDEPPV